MIDPKRPPRPGSVELRRCESLVETGATGLQRCTALTTARGRLRRPVFGALLVVAGCREAQDTAPHTSAQVAAARPAEAPVTDVPEPGAAATLNVTPGTNAAAPMLERNPDASDLSTWKRLPDIPEGCTVHLAEAPEETFAPLPFQPCADRRGCQEFIPSWGTERDDVVAYAVDPTAGRVIVHTGRGGSDASTRRSLHVIETLDGKAVFAIALQAKDDGCVATLQVSETGLAFSVIEANTRWARVATASWDAPTALHWTLVNARDLRKLQDTESFPWPNALTPEGLWWGQDWSFSRLDLSTGRIALLAPLRPRGTRVDDMVAVDGGVIASLHTDGETHHGGLGFFEPALRPVIVLPQRRGISIAKLAVSRAPVEEVFWIEEDQDDRSQCVLFAAATARRAVDFRPRSVAELPLGCSLLTGPALAHGGRVAHVAGSPIAGDPGELQIVAVDTGRGWRVPAAPGREWGSPVGLTSQAIWVTSQDASVRVDSGWKFGARPGIVRLDLAELGPAIPLK